MSTNLTALIRNSSRARYRRTRNPLAFVCRPRNPSTFRQRCRRGHAFLALTEAKLANRTIGRLACALPYLAHTEFGLSAGGFRTRATLSLTFCRSGLSPTTRLQRQFAFTLGTSELARSTRG
ncbi:MAG: hypothetical protein ACR2OV_09650 [Hyphomicrobiaceae bacterium]